MTVGNNPTDKRKLGKTKRHILTDKKGIPISVVISSANTHDIKRVTKMWLIMQSSKDHQINLNQEEENFNIYVLIKHISEPEEHKLIKRGYVLHIPTKRKIDAKERKMQKIRMKIQQQQQSCLKRKKYSAKRWVVERTNSWHNRFRK